MAEGGVWHSSGYALGGASRWMALWPGVAGARALPDQGADAGQCAAVLGGSWAEVLPLGDLCPRSRGPLAGEDGRVQEVVEDERTEVNLFLVLVVSLKVFRRDSLGGREDLQRVGFCGVEGAQKFGDGSRVGSEEDAQQRLVLERDPARRRGQPPA